MPPRRRGALAGGDPALLRFLRSIEKLTETTRDAAALDRLARRKVIAWAREIGAEIRLKFSIHRLAIVHRLGRLEIGETSVWIAVSAAHRGAAFDACRHAIDTLKRAVPIWKKEYFAGGAVWADGEVPSQEAISGQNESSS